MNSMTKNKFKIGSHVVFPKYGVGKCESYQKINIDGKDYNMLVINFDKCKMVLRLPKDKLHNVRCRSLSTPEQMHEALQIISTPRRLSRRWWKHRSDAYYKKINSSQLHLIAEVISELRPRITTCTDSMSEFDLYKIALDLFTQELMVVDACDMKTALGKIEDFCSMG